MNHRRALMLLEPDEDAVPVLTTLRRLAPGLERLVIVSRLPAPSFAWLSGESTRALDAALPAPLELLKAQAAQAARSVEVRVVPSLGGKALAELGAAEDVDLVVVGMRSLRTTAALNQVRRQLRVAVLFVGGPPRSGPVRTLRCYAPGRLGRLSIRTFLRDHADETVQVTLLAPPERAPQELQAILEVAGVRARVVDAVPGEASLRQALESGGPGDPVDLVVVARIPAPLLLGLHWPAPVLLLPPLASERRPLVRPLDAADVIDDRGVLHLRMDQLSAVGDLPSLPDQQVAIVAAGRVVAIATTRRGATDLAAEHVGDSLGLYRMGEEAPANPLAAIEARVLVIRPGERPLIVFDSEIPGEVLEALSGLSGPPAPELLAVRLRPVRSCRSIRERLRALGIPARVLDARGVLDEGEALDVSEANDPVRLARVAAQLRRAGFPVTTIVHRGAIQPEVHGFTSLAAPELLDGSAALPPDPLQDVAPAGPTPITGVSPIAGNRLELELDNAAARRWLLDGIHASRESVHLQVYMVLDDDAGAPVEAALAEAGARGVQVKVLVDSLHGFHGSFGTTNPFLERLASRPGVELRVSRPITELPSLTELKQRDHRKLVVLDGRVALVGGRNLSHEYYAAFDEVALGPETGWREVPWLDAGARVEGPAVTALAASFLEAWTAAGGETFALPTPAPVGTSSARVIVHHGLRDARTLEAYLELVDGATSHVYTVNGFPLVLELQHALLRALRRGVRVRVLSGHVTPTHDGTPFPGPWSTARTAATELVHSRLDPIVAEGGEAFLFALRDLPGWAPGLGLVHPHVHAKVMSVDGKRCAVGSANLDITASYWESELMLLVEDPALVEAYEARIEALIAGSVRLRRTNAAWKEQARRRAWMRHWPGVLSV